MVWKHLVTRPGQITHPMPIGRAQAHNVSETHPIFWLLRFCLVKTNKKTSDLQIFTLIGKTVKRLY